jgi:predicted  nucleic acid-binding Zn-ribbon protein
MITKSELDTLLKAGDIEQHIEYCSDVSELKHLHGLLVSAFMSIHHQFPRRKSKLTAFKAKCHTMPNGRNQYLIKRSEYEAWKASAIQVQQTIEDAKRLCKHYIAKMEESTTTNEYTRLEEATHSLEKRMNALTEKIKILQNQMDVLLHAPKEQKC